jgi:hypothetical protein
MAPGRLGAEVSWGFKVTSMGAVSKSGRWGGSSLGMGAAEPGKGPELDASVQVPTAARLTLSKCHSTRGVVPQKCGLTE